MCVLKTALTTFLLYHIDVLLSKKYMFAFAKKKTDDLGLCRLDKVINFSTIFKEREEKIMPYLMKTIYAGDTIEKIKVFSGRYGIRTSPVRVGKASSEQVKQINLLNTERELRWLLNENFRANKKDMHVVVTYKKENRPTNRVDAVKDIKNLLRRLKRKNKKLKYVYVTVWSNKAVPHHHLVISGATAEEIQESWGERGCCRSTFLYKKDGVNDFRGLAEYLVKQSEKDMQRPKGARRYNPSHNLRPAKIITKKCTANKWRKNVSVPDGYISLESEHYQNELMCLTYDLWRFAKLIT